MDNNLRYFVDIRSGCAAIRDRHHPDYNPDYQGLHFDTIDVVEYKHGFQNKEIQSWDMLPEDIEHLVNKCKILNEKNE